MDAVSHLTTRPRLEAAIAEFAPRQYGLVTSAQLRARSVPGHVVRRAAAAGRLRLIHAGVYLVSGVRPTFESRTLAQCLRGASGVTLAAGHTAAILWGLDGVTSDGIEVITTRNMRSSEGDVTIRRVVEISPCDVSCSRGIPVTSVARTLLDLAAVLREEELECALDDALRRRLVSVPRMLWRVRDVGAQGRRGAGVLENLVRGRVGGAANESVLEVKVWRFLRGLDVQAPRRQHVVKDAGRFIARVDFAYPEVKLAIEAHSFRWHSGRIDWERDVGRDHALRRLGWTVCYVTDRMLGRQRHELKDYIERFVTRQTSMFGR